MTKDIQTVGVVGAGTMGAGIAQLLVQHDIEVHLYDVSESVLTLGEERVLKGLERAERPGAFNLMRKTTRMDALETCDLVIEAASEDLAVKLEVFRKLDTLMEPTRPIATNTSSLPIARIAAATENPQRVVGMHFFNPAPIMRLVEVVRSEFTSDATVATIEALAESLEKTAVRCKDTPGFIVNRVARPFYLQSMRLVERGAGTPADIDRVMREAGFKMGALELVDLIGLDVNFATSTQIYQALGSPDRLKPTALQAMLVAKGYLGRKKSGGFYAYGENPPGTINPVLEDLVPEMGSHPMKPHDVLKTVIDAVVQEARVAVSEEVASRESVDTAMRLGMGWPKGPFEWEKTISRDAS
ncbi:MAG: 3-hydroxybutyryl-CoA dehydrogenase [Elusimicrobia bacterium]|nr:3-hydroxybutyryl-CoA dehydrogenase [Elusimicrobiota bacterium]